MQEKTTGFSKIAIKSKKLTTKQDVPPAENAEAPRVAPVENSEAPRILEEQIDSTVKHIENWYRQFMNVYNIIS